MKPNCILGHSHRKEQYRFHWGTGKYFKLVQLEMFCSANTITMAESYRTNLKIRMSYFLISLNKSLEVQFASTIEEDKI